MKMRKLGANGPDISALGYGAMSFADFYGKATEAGSHAILDLARDLGVTHLDTSNVYGMGQSESFIGSYLANNPGARDAFHIATKAAISKDASGTRCFDNSPAHFEAELDKSLKRLGVDHVDLYYCHRRQADIPIEEVTGTLDALRQPLMSMRYSRNIRFKPAFPNWGWCRPAPSWAPRWWPFRPSGAGC